MSEQSQVVVRNADELWRVSTRRSFLKALGVGGAIVLLPSVFTACSDSNETTSPNTTGPVSLNLSTDYGILNYAYALEQLEAGFYSAVVASSAFGGMSAEQKEVMVDLRNHEVIHREFLKAALGSNAIGSLALNTKTVGSATASTASILQTAETFEDLGVAAYNGAGKYLASADLLTVAGKIVSVEARHAAAIRDLREEAGVAGTPPGARFAGDDVVQPPSSTYQGLDVKLEPNSVLALVAAKNVLSTSLSIGTAPATKSGTPDAFPS